MIEAMSKYAASIGFRGLKLMYKRYQQSIRTSQGAYIGENPTNFENQPIELDAGKWEADDSGVRRSDGFGDAVACPHPILPVERLVNIDTGEEKLRLAFRKGAIWRKIIVSKVILANANKVTELAGCGVAVTSQNARAFVEYISDIENLNYDVIPERKSIGRFGYIPDEGFSPFVDGLIFDGDASFAAMFQTVRSHGSEAKWLDIAAEVRAMSTTAKIILAASFSSVLLEPLGCLPFFVHLWGVDSGTGKTVALMVAASVWGDPAMLNGCNYISPGTKRSAPFAIFNRQDLLRLNRILDAPVPEVYGEIVGEDVDGVHYTAAYIREIAATEPDRLDSITLRTTLAQRTGCSMCGFGITLEKRPHRFDLLREQNPQEWEFWMKHVLQDENGEWYGWGRVLDYIGVGWEDIPTSRK